MAPKMWAWLWGRKVFGEAAVRLEKCLDEIGVLNYSLSPVEEEKKGRQTGSHSSTYPRQEILAQGQKRLLPSGLWLWVTADMVFGWGG